MALIISLRKAVMQITPKKGKATVILRGTGANYGGQRKITYTISSKKLVWWKTLLS